MRKIVTEWTGPYRDNIIIIGRKQLIQQPLKLKQPSRETEIDVQWTVSNIFEIG